MPFKIMDKVILVPYIDDVLQEIRNELTKNIDKHKKLKDYVKEFGLKLVDPCPISWLEVNDELAEIVIMVNTPCSYTLQGMVPTEKQTNQKTLGEFFSELVHKGIPEAVWADKTKRTALATKKVKIPPERFLSEYTNAVTELKMKDNEVRDMAMKIKSKGTTYELIVCENPSDYNDMFSCKTGSCMEHRPNMFYGVNTEWDEAKEKYKIHPGSWYHWTGSSKGVFLRHNQTKAIIARAMLYSNAIDQFDTYGDIHYSGHAGANQLMKDHLVAAGYKAGNIGWEDKGWKPTKQFRVPAYVIGGELRQPYPFGDRVNWSSFGVFFDEDTHEFVHVPDKGPAPFRYAHKGYMKASAVPPYVKALEKAA